MTERLIQLREHMIEQPGNIVNICAEIAPIFSPVSYGQRLRQKRWQRSWSAKYNAARIHAAVLPYLSAGPQGEQATCAGQPADAAVALLESAINDPDCEMERPFDWIARDRGFSSLWEEPVFLKFLCSQLYRDYPGVRHADDLACAECMRAALREAAGSQC